MNVIDKAYLAHQLDLNGNYRGADSLDIELRQVLAANSDVAKARVLPDLVTEEKHGIGPAGLRRMLLQYPGVKIVKDDMLSKMAKEHNPHAAFHGDEGHLWVYPNGTLVNLPTNHFVTTDKIREKLKRENFRFRRDKDIDKWGHYEFFMQGTGSIRVSIFGNTMNCMTMGAPDINQLRTLKKIKDQYGLQEVKIDYNGVQGGIKEFKNISSFAEFLKEGIPKWGEEKPQEIKVEPVSSESASVPITKDPVPSASQISGVIQPEIEVQKPKYVAPPRAESTVFPFLDDYTQQRIDRDWDNRRLSKKKKNEKNNK